MAMQDLQMNEQPQPALRKTIVSRRFSQVSEYTADKFIARYKGHSFYISKLEKRNVGTVFDIEVTDPRGCYAVNTWEEVGTIDEAIAYALKGACL